MRTQFPAEVVKDGAIPDAWRVEKLDSDEDGGVDITIFSGPNAHQRAAEYAVWKYGTQSAEVLPLRNAVKTHINVNHIDGGVLLPVALSRALPEHFQSAWLAEALKPIRHRQLFKFGEIADALARKPGRQEVDRPESYLIGIDLVEWFERGEFGDDEVLVHCDDPPPFRPLKPLLEVVRQQMEQDGARVEMEWRELILTRSALKTYLERSSLDGFARLLSEWFSDTDGGGNKRPAATGPTPAQLDEWMRRNVKPGHKREPTIADCRSATGATVRGAKAAWDAAPGR